MLLPTHRSGVWVFPPNPHRLEGKHLLRGAQSWVGTCPSSTLTSPWSPLPSWRLSPPPPQHPFSASYTQAGWQLAPGVSGGCSPSGCCVGGCQAALSSASTGK